MCLLEKPDTCLAQGDNQIICLLHAGILSRPSIHHCTTQRIHWAASSCLRLPSAWRHHLNCCSGYLLANPSPPISRGIHNSFLLACSRTYGLLFWFLALSPKYLQVQHFSRILTWCNGTDKGRLAQWTMNK